MPATIKTVVTFESAAFNTSAHKDYFINQGCFGDDVAIWLIEELRRRKFETAAKPRQEDFGWYLTFLMSGTEHCLVIGYLPGGDTEGGVWIGWLERSRGFFTSILGGRQRGIQREAAQTIHDILSDAPQIRNVRWHFKDDFDNVLEELGTRRP